MEHEENDRPPTADEHAEIARRALDEEDLAHGLLHLSEALAAEPDREEWVGLLDAYLDKAGDDSLSLIDGEEEGYYALEAVRAYILARMGQYDRAVDWLCEVVGARPDAQYLETWAIGWLADDRVRDDLARRTWQKFFGLYVTRYPERWRLSETSRRRLARLRPLVDAVETTDPTLQIWFAALDRKLGRYGEALERARRAHANDPSWLTAIGIAIASREGGHHDDAIEWFLTALALDPSDLSARLELGDLFLQRSDWEAALGWYEEVLEREDDHSWAVPSAAYCRFRIDGSEDHIDQIIEMIDDPDSGTRAYELYRNFLPYTGYLPEPSDATANCLRQLIEVWDEEPPAEGSALRLTLSHIEAPSNRLAFALELARRGQELSLEFEVRDVPEPDPRRASTAVEFLLWEYDALEPRPAVDPPPIEVVDEIAALAGGRYDYDRGWEAARAVAGRLGTARAGAILATMVHPPALPEGRAALEWLPRVQLAATHVLAHLDGGWAGSLRRRVLLDIARGPVDWTVVAAVVSLARLALEEGEAVGEVGALFRDLEARIPDDRHACYEYALYANWLLLPGLDEGERRRLTAALQDLAEED